MRLHVGNGSILLRDWVNVDLPLPHVFLAKERPDLVERFITDDNNYYGRHGDKDPSSLRSGPVTKETVCDVYGSFGFLPVRPQSVSEIWSVQVFEHLDRRESHEALEECRRVLVPGGVLKLDIPDPDETLRLYHKTGDEFWKRHLFGPRASEYGFHRHYNQEMLIELCHSHGFEFGKYNPNIHEFYPAIAMEFHLLLTPKRLAIL